MQIRSLLPASCRWEGRRLVGQVIHPSFCLTGGTRTAPDRWQPSPRTPTLVSRLVFMCNLHRYLSRTAYRNCTDNRTQSEQSRPNNSMYVVQQQLTFAAIECLGKKRSPPLWIKSGSALRNHLATTFRVVSLSLPLELPEHILSVQNSWHRVAAATS